MEENENNNFWKSKNPVKDNFSFPKINLGKLKGIAKNKGKIKATPGFLAVLIILVAIVAGGAGAVFTNYYWQNQVIDIFEQQGIPIISKGATIQNNYIPQTTQEQKIIKAVKDYSPAVVSIVISKDVPILEKYYIDPFGGLNWPFGADFLVPQYRENGTEKQQVGGGTGFIISSDGTILTNKHVTLEEDAEYTVFFNDGSKYPAKILAKDPFYDLAVLKVDQSDTPEAERKTFPTVKLGDSSSLQIGQTVIAIGYALGEFQNTVSVGVVSGLGRNITATGGQGFSENLEGIIQTDAAINPGNSGGPLLNLAGEVIGINVARSSSGENIGFSLPINMAKRDIDQVKKTGTIVYPWLGISYTIITKEISEANNLSVDYGAWIGKDSLGKDTEIAVVSGSPAAKLGIKKNDIILEFNGVKITSENPLAKIILDYNPNDSVNLKILRDKEDITLTVILGERKE
ncbi:trypsin-like peptidase domain-containing protein [Patescibacteria group bacterium]|nr:trypsin-like peptidase domain-containing protein [Patescibacteria group bacterium]MBU4162347.1 trypsin-like peptidase domain-containing protein [Patescibacteria group bacterium]